MIFIDAEQLQDGLYNIKDGKIFKYKAKGGTARAYKLENRPQGEWIEVDDVSISCRCSVCGWEAHLYEDDVYGMPYCPNCGARMKGADDDRND